MWKISESDPVLLKVDITIHKNSVKNGLWLEKDRKKLMINLLKTLDQDIFMFNSDLGKD